MTLPNRSRFRSRCERAKSGIVSCSRMPTTSSTRWIWAIDLEGTHSYTNPAIQQILGYKTEEVLGANVLDFVHLSDRGELEKFLKQQILEERGWTGLALRWRHKHEGYRYLESSGLPVFDAQGKLAGYQGANRDITEQ